MADKGDIFMYNLAELVINYIMLQIHMHIPCFIMIDFKEAGILWQVWQDLQSGD